VENDAGFHDRFVGDISQATVGAAVADNPQDMSTSLS
jgi:hypothetical protein